MTLTGLAVSELDGAAAGAQTVFAVIIGTDAARRGIQWAGAYRRAMARQVRGTNPLPWMDEDELRYREKSLVIAANKVVLKPLFRARDSRWIIVV